MSVRSVEEVESALRGGAEILDVKDPLAGSLGMASVETIHQISRSLAQSRGPSVVMSVALGEVVDWLRTTVPRLPAGITFAKLGLSHCGELDHWKDEWCRVRGEFAVQASSRLRWVAVAYADAADAAAPDPAEILQASIETGCAGLLVDTWIKDGRAVCDFLDASTLIRLIDQCHAAGMFFALAGRITPQLLPELAGIPADVIGIRTAACLNDDRTASIDCGRLSAFHQQMCQAFRKR